MPIPTEHRRQLPHTMKQDTFSFDGFSDSHVSQTLSLSCTHINTHIPTHTHTHTHHTHTHTHSHTHTHNGNTLCLSSFFIFLLSPLVLSSSLFPAFFLPSPLLLS